MNAELTTEIVGKVESALNTLAAKIGVGVDHFWPLFVRQQFIEGVSWVSLIAVGLVILVGSLITMKIIWPKCKWEYDGSPVSPVGLFFIIFAAISILLFLILTIGASINADNIVSHLVNPEYQAFQDLMKMVK